MTPPMPWAKFEDGEPLGWEASWRIWKAWLLPYRTAEFLGLSDDGTDMLLGPWKWHRPNVLRRRDRA
jgi:hypothetical protein